MCRVFGVCPLSQNVINEVLAQKHNAQEMGSFPKYANWPEELRERMTRIIGNTADRLGYVM